MYFGVSIRRIGIDAPSDHKLNALKRRKAEEALDARGIRCFTTPSADEFAAIREKAQTHLRNGGAEFRLPHANQLWMLVGFALFERLRLDWECLEVFPQATMFMLDASATHKSKPGGVAAQLKAIARVQVGQIHRMSCCSRQLFTGQSTMASMHTHLPGLPLLECNSELALGCPRPM